MKIFATLVLSLILIGGHSQSITSKVTLADGIIEGTAETGIKKCFGRIIESIKIGYANAC